MIVSIHQSTSVVNPNQPASQPGMGRQFTDNYEENMFVWYFIFILADFECQYSYSR